MKKLVLVLVVLVIVGAAGAYFVLRSGLGGSDEWVVRRVTRIAETYIQPKIDFQSFDWNGGKTITLRGVTLTADDGTEVVTAGSMIIITERVPVTGGAFIIQAITLEDATLRLVQTTDPDGSIGFKGLVPFVRERNITNQDRVDKEVKLSETFKIREIKLVNGGFEYDTGDGAPMRLKEINLDVNLTPEDQGDYALDVKLRRDRIFDIALTGDLNIDSMAVKGTNLSFDADLKSEEAMSALPPQIQSLIRRYEVKGIVKSTISGDIQLTDPTASDMQMEVILNDGNLALGDYRFPISGMRMTANLASKQLSVPDFDVSTIGGMISLTSASADLSADGWPADVAWEAADLDIQRLLRYQPEDSKPPRFAGILTTMGRATTNLQSPQESLDGSGELTLRNGRLVSIPIITDLIDAMDVVASLTGTTTFKDRADITFNLDPKGVEFPDKGLQISTQLAAVRGSGRINFDQTLRLSVNGGPVEKLQDDLGGIGSILGAVTDGFLKYIVDNTISDPKVSVRPLGIGG